MTLTPLFPMELYKMKNGEELRVLTEKVHKILSKTLQEIPETRVSGRVGSGQSNKRSIINLHNQRFYYDFTVTTELSLLLSSYIKPDENKMGRGSGATTIQLINNGTTYRINNFCECTVYIRRKTIEVRYKKATAKWHYIDHGQKGAKEFIDIVQKNNRACKVIVKEFIDVYGGKSDFKLQNIYYHAKTQDKTIKKIPKAMKFNNNVVQKAYNEHNIEFLTPQATINYLTTEGIKDFLPSICRSIEMLSESIQTVNPLRVLKMKCARPQDALEYPEIVRQLTDYEKRLLWRHWFRGVSNE